jgi:diadenosine tetraphosphate (Ap4A) HIT family hydrolase
MNEIIKFENDSVIGISSTDADGKAFDKTLVGSFVIIPKSHVETPFDLSEQEWLDTKKMIDTVKKFIDEKYCPDGYNLGWNVGRAAGQVVSYAHLHIIPRFRDEPLAGKGIRYWIKQKENIRPSLKEITHG